MKTQKREYKIKPLPKNIWSWCKELIGVNRFINDIPKYGIEMGNGWMEKQTAYYRFRLKTLLNNPPPLPHKSTFLKIMKEYQTATKGQ